MGNRVWKQSDNGTTTTARKYVVDITGGLPTILCELDGNSLKNSYVYADGQILKQDNSGGSYYYIHDRLGSVRLVVDNTGTVKNSYTYSPFGEDLATECTENTESLRKKDQ